MRQTQWLLDRRLVAEVLLQLKYTLLMRIVRITFVIVEDHIGGANAEVRSQGKACVRGNGRLADVHMLQHQVWQQRTATLQAQLDVAARAPVAAKVAEIPSGQRDADLGDVVVDTLHDKAVLCVGGRSGSVPTYRQIVEGTGGRFLHHDGGEEHNPVQLDTSRAAADLVICQTGCISHDTYWRVNDHCKRHGKQCVSWISPVLQASPAACVPFGSCTTHSLASVVPGVCGNPSHPI